MVEIDDMSLESIKAHVKTKFGAEIKEAEWRDVTKECVLEIGDDSESLYFIRVKYKGNRIATMFGKSDDNGIELWSSGGDFKIKRDSGLYNGKHFKIMKRGE